MFRRCTIVVLLGLLPLAGSVLPARAADLTYVSGPGAQITNYTIPVFVIEQGDTAQYVNIDIASHNVVSTTFTDAGVCAARPLPYDGGPCPLFQSQLVGPGKPVRIYGIENTVSGQTYTFGCSIHPSMLGSLVVLP